MTVSPLRAATQVPDRSHTPSTYSDHAGTRPRPLPLTALVDALSIRDLTDPADGPHAIQALVDHAIAALTALWTTDVRVERSRPVVSLEDNYDRLGYAPDAISRDVRYTRYVSDTTMLRSHTSAGIPPALRRLAASSADQILLVLPGICHRRDSIDRIHTGTPHQLDLWLLRRGGRRLDHDDLHDMVGALVAALLPGTHWRWTTADHPYTEGGREVDAIKRGDAVEIAECGLAAAHVLDTAGLEPSEWSGLALGMGLDRMLMLRKGIPDIRLLRSPDPRIAGQMHDLEPYRPVSDLPPVLRDISIATRADANAEVLGDRIRVALGADAELVEELTILSTTQYDALPPAARERLGIRPGQVNLLVRLILRPVDRTMTSDDANTLRERIYSALHETTAT
jgi:phenylalanyl-tRNA synthetase alpha chain